MPRLYAVAFKLYLDDDDDDARPSYAVCARARAIYDVNA